MEGRRAGGVESLDHPGVTLRSETLIALRRVALATEIAAGLAALPGGFATKRRGHGLEVADMREYVLGDDFRHLDRGTTARTGRLHVRRFHEERDRITLLVADFRPSMFWGLRRAFRSVAAAEALALIGWRCVEAGGRVALLVVHQGPPVVLPPRGRARAMLGVIGALVDAHAAGLQARMAGEAKDTDLSRALVRADRIVPPGSEIVIASGFDAPGADLADRLDALALRRQPKLLAIEDGQAARMPRGRYPVQLSDGRRLRVTLGGDPMVDTRAAIAGRTALPLDAGDPIEATARRIALAFSQDFRQ